MIKGLLYLAVDLQKFATMENGRVVLTEENKKMFYVLGLPTVLYYPMKPYLLINVRIFIILKMKGESFGMIQM